MITATTTIVTMTATTTGMTIATTTASGRDPETVIEPGMDMWRFNNAIMYISESLQGLFTSGL